MPKKTDPLSQLTDKELYNGHTRGRCRVDDSHPYYFWYSPKEEPHEELEDEMPSCCRLMARATQTRAAEVAKTLNGAGIGCVLWAWSMYGVYGVAHMTPNIDFIVADCLIDQAIEVLLNTPPRSFPKVEHCLDEETCFLIEEDPYYHDPDRSRVSHAPAPYIHLHTGFAYKAIRLWKQSETIWALPTLTELPIPGPGSQFNLGKLALTLSPNYTVAAHPRFPEYRTIRAAKNPDHYGRHPADLHPVVIMTPERGFETAMRTHARFSTPNVDLYLERIIVEWLHELKTGNDSIVDVEQITPELRPLVKTALEGNMTGRHMRYALREILGEAPHEDGVTWQYWEDFLFLSDSAWAVDRDDPHLSLKVHGTWNPFARRWKSKSKWGGDGKGPSKDKEKEQ